MFVEIDIQEIEMCVTPCPGERELTPNIITKTYINNNFNRSCAHSGFDSKIIHFFMFLYELFPFKMVKSVHFHAKFNENNICLSHNLYKILML